MALPTSYLTSTKNLTGILNAIQGAQAPKAFTNTFLVQLEFKSSSDRLVIGVLKALGFLDAQGVPTPRYHEFLDQSQSKAVMATAVREAYADLFQVNTKANELSVAEVKNKLKTLTQGSASNQVISKMAMTFKALCDQADFSAPSKEPGKASEDDGEHGEKETDAPKHSTPLRAPGISGLGGLVYNIQLVLPETRDPAVYEALFRSLREHLL